MTTDVSLVMLSVNLVYYLKVKASRKVAVVACFAPRILVIAASLTRLVYLYPITPHTNPAFNLWIPVIVTQVQASLSIVTACIPYMRPFFYSSDAQVPEDKGSRRHMMVGEESYTHFSSNGYARGHKRGQGLSQDTTTPNSWPNSWDYGRNHDVSPRIPSPAPLSPLLPPRLTTPPNSYETTSRSPSERGLKLQIPKRDTSAGRRATFISPQTASSHALSPDCMSPVAQPFLTNNDEYFPIPLAPRSPTPPQPCHTPPNAAVYSGDDSDTEPPVRNPRTRFSLFPSHQAPRYSLVPQLNPQPPTSNPTNVLEHSRSHSRTLTGATSMPRLTPQVGAHETPTTSSAPPAEHAQHQPSAAPPQATMRKSPPKFTSPNPTIPFATIAYDDPLRIKSPPATALTTSAPTPAPLVTAPLPAVVESPQTSSQIIRQYARPLLPSIVTQSPSRRLRSESNPTSIASVTTTSQHTPPPSHPPPTGPLPRPPTSTSITPPKSRPRSRSSPYQYSSPHHTPSPLVSPTSPTRQRNRRILTPKNSSRDFNLSPVSPVSPPTPMQFWREEAFGNGAGRTAVPSVMWEEHELQAATMGMRSPRSGARDGGVGAPLRSPRIVLQREV
ncbi:hypothetical protein DM02DRAFT_373631 [Periconia macrospinosa]|uniref:Rhodopsin domain-containing protein n=1 Tax=Periconia macrospinosa TaxID=97972 RepID=A0A2V1DRT6_9PLEO|nr:hypothetical protein DM02DRAFT_373631 [Periconia macrospinosa]